MQPKQVSLVLPGGPYGDKDLQAFAAVADSLDLSLLEIAWEIAGAARARRVLDMHGRRPAWHGMRWGLPGTYARDKPSILRRAPIEHALPPTQHAAQRPTWVAQLAYGIRPI